MKISEQERLEMISAPDREFWKQSGIVLAGMDEVGRGPLAGPVVVGCVVMPADHLIPHINDSKKISPKRREELYEIITDKAIAYSTAWVGPDVIDKINILEATRRAFYQAFHMISINVTDVLIDALSGTGIEAKQHIIIHGDALSYSIAAASILAKVERDRYMLEQAELYPEYAFSSNKGYGTKEHIEALKKYGPCPIHRKSFIGHFISD